VHRQETAKSFGFLALVAKAVQIKTNGVGLQMDGLSLIFAFSEMITILMHIHIKLGAKS